MVRSGPQVTSTGNRVLKHISTVSRSAVGQVLGTPSGVAAQSTSRASRPVALPAVTRTNQGDRTLVTLRATALRRRTTGAGRAGVSRPGRGRTGDRPGRAAPGATAAADARRAGRRGAARPRPPPPGPAPPRRGAPG